jgi:lipid-A-disaccharide synthase
MPNSTASALLNHHVLIVAGEASGDLHGSNLVKALKRLRPATEFFGIGGPRMMDTGVRVLVHSSDIAVVGLTEVVKKIPKILSALKTIKMAVSQRRPSLVVLIDYPDFNLLVAKYARRAGIPVLYFISPQVWAWRKRRVHTIARRVDRMAVILPFERDFYLENGVPVTYVGHPLLDVCPPVGSRIQAARFMGINTDGPVIGLLPGSRSDEIRNLMPAMAGTARMLLRRYPKLHCVLPLASTVDEEFVRSFVPKDLPIEIYRKDIYTLLNACDAAVVASGTATLEAALMETPLVIGYKVSPLTYRVGKLVIKAPAIGLANLVAGENYFTELIQHEVTPGRLYREVVSMLEDPDIRSRVRKGLYSVRKRLGDKGACERTAALAAEIMDAGLNGLRS